MSTKSATISKGGLLLVSARYSTGVDQSLLEAWMIAPFRSSFGCMSLLVLAVEAAPGSVRNGRLRVERNRASLSIE